ncbi:uncharacterized protein RCO7_03906 [Rhynchosporium graminicola]|uniref:Glucose receptor Git3-like N-terminal domain-containing protein n=1 Tax=Rhynchosporium graminicola TaxID=2792576 RepID=A0A1E1L5Q4_9HELO|nr:uncharacterized protein RCO7_03906 [Rhynchosporium commune]
MVNGRIDLLTVLVTLTGSLLSLLGTAFILISYMILPQKRHIRHALIINLTVAGMFDHSVDHLENRLRDEGQMLTRLDFLNAANNGSSGLWVLIRNTPLRPGAACTFNGFVGQLSVQTVDFSILTITIVTLWVVTSSRSRHDVRLSYILIFCCGSWAVPLITSGIALSMNAYGPAASNWCWIEQDPTYLRYALTHGWRFVIIAAVVSMCTYIQLFLRRHSELMDITDIARSYQEEMILSQKSEIRLDSQEISPSPGPVDNDPPSPPPTALQNIKAVFTRPKVDPRNELSLRPPSKQDQQKSIQKAMLLHAYPIFYIILWLPGIATRIVQATGHTSYVLQVLQASTQFIGFANAITFGWNERIGEQMRGRIWRK